MWTLGGARRGPCSVWQRRPLCPYTIIITRVMHYGLFWVRSGKRGKNHRLGLAYHISVLTRWPTAAPCRLPRNRPVSQRALLTKGPCCYCCCCCGRPPQWKIAGAGSTTMMPGIVIARMVVVVVAAARCARRSRPVLLCRCKGRVRACAWLHAVRSISTDTNKHKETQPQFSIHFALSAPFPLCVPSRPAAGGTLQCPPGAAGGAGGS